MSMLKQRALKFFSFISSIRKQNKRKNLAKSLSCGIWPKPLQRVFDLDPNASSIFIPLMRLLPTLGFDPPFLDDWQYCRTP